MFHIFFGLGISPNHSSCMLFHVFYINRFNELAKNIILQIGLYFSYVLSQNIIYVFALVLYFGVSMSFQNEYLVFSAPSPK